MKTSDAEFFFGAYPITFERARILRKRMTLAERKLWSCINHLQIYGLQFRRQHPIWKFIADFYCHKVRLVIEVDGDVHLPIEQKERDEGRDYYMKDLELSVLRFTNDEVMNNIQDVISKIKLYCSQTNPDLLK